MSNESIEKTRKYFEEVIGCSHTFHWENNGKRGVFSPGYMKFEQNSKANNDDFFGQNRNKIVNHQGECMDKLTEKTNRAINEKEKNAKSYHEIKNNPTSSLISDSDKEVKKGGNEVFKENSSIFVENNNDLEIKRRENKEEQKRLEAARKWHQRIKAKREVAKEKENIELQKRLSQENELVELRRNLKETREELVKVKIELNQFESNQKKKEESAQVTVAPAALTQKHDSRPEETKRTYYWITGGLGIFAGIVLILTYLFKRKK